MVRDTSAGPDPLTMDIVNTPERFRDWVHSVQTYQLSSGNSRHVTTMMANPTVVVHLWNMIEQGVDQEYRHKYNRAHLNAYGLTDEGREEWTRNYLYNLTMEEIYRAYLVGNKIPTHGAVNDTHTLAVALTDSKSSRHALSRLLFDRTSQADQSMNRLGTQLAERDQTLNINDICKRSTPSQTRDLWAEVTRHISRGGNNFANLWQRYVLDIIHKGSSTTGLTYQTYLMIARRVFHEQKDRSIQLTLATEAPGTESHDDSRSSDWRSRRDGSRDFPKYNDRSRTYSTYDDRSQGNRSSEYSRSDDRRADRSARDHYENRARDSPPHKKGDPIACHGCGLTNRRAANHSYHSWRDCPHRDHPDFNSHGDPNLGASFCDWRDTRAGRALKRHLERTRGDGLDRDGKERPRIPQGRLESIHEHFLCEPRLYPDGVPYQVRLPNSDTWVQQARVRHGTSDTPRDPKRGRSQEKYIDPADRSGPAPAVAPPTGGMRPLTASTTPLLCYSSPPQLSLLSPAINPRTIPAICQVVAEDAITPSNLGTILRAGGTAIPLEDGHEHPHLPVTAMGGVEKAIREARGNDNLVGVDSNAKWDAHLHVPPCHCHVHSTPHILACTYFDSGAESANYITRQAVTALNLKITHGPQHHVCAAFGQCTSTTALAVLRLAFPTEPPPQSAYVLAFRVIDSSPFPLIIGRPTLVAFALWSRFYERKIIPTRLPGTGPTRETSQAPCKSLVDTPDLVRNDERARDHSRIIPSVSESGHLELPCSTATSSCSAVDVNAGGEAPLVPDATPAGASVVTPLTPPVSIPSGTQNALRRAPSGPRPVASPKVLVEPTTSPLATSSAGRDNQGRTPMLPLSQPSTINLTAMDPHYPTSGRPAETSNSSPTPTTHLLQLPAVANTTLAPPPVSPMDTSSSPVPTSRILSNTTYLCSISGLDIDVVPDALGTRQVSAALFTHRSRQDDLASDPLRPTAHTSQVHGLPALLEQLAIPQFPAISPTRKFRLLRLGLSLSRNSLLRLQLHQMLPTGTRLTPRVRKRPTLRFAYTAPSWLPILRQAQAIVDDIGCWSSNWFMGTTDAHLSWEAQRRRMLTFIRHVAFSPTMGVIDFETASLTTLADVFSDDTVRLATDTTILRKPLKDLLAFGSEAEGIDLPEPPVYSTQQDHATSYIPPDIQGADVPISGSPQTTLKSALQDVCTRHLPVFNTKLGKTPARVQPYNMEVDESQWHVNANRTACRPQSLGKQAEVDKQLTKMKGMDIVVESQAPYYSQVHLTPKPHQKPGEPTSWRFCIDYRRLNVATASNGWPIPNIRDMLARLGAQKAKYFCKLDLTSGYHQAPLAESSRKYTAFRTFNGIYEWLRVPMGLKGAPSYFQKAMETEVLRDLLGHMCEIYIDDIIIYAPTAEDMVARLDTVLARLHDHNITVSPEKCSFGITEVEFLGHTINHQGIRFSRDKLDKVLQIEPPTTQKQLKSFLGVTIFFSDHIANYSDRVRPLNALVRTYKPSKIISWTDSAIAAFADIRQAINECPTLYFLDDTQPIYVNTDASDFGIGAICYQILPHATTGIDVVHPVAFMSKNLSTQECNWTTTEKECYAIVYAFKKFEYLLTGRPFTLLTDHRNLIYIDSESSPKVRRWKLAIQHYDCVVAHIAGKKNVVADAFSRLLPPTPETTDVTSTLASLFWHRVDHMCHDHSSHKPTIRSLPVLSSQSSLLDSNVFAAMQDGQTIPPEAARIITKFHNSRVGHHGVERTISQISRALAAASSDSKNPVTSWAYMRSHVKSFIKQCPLCQKMAVLKSQIQTTPFVTSAYEPMERINLDTIGPLPPSRSGYTYILVLVDCFTRWVSLYPMKDLTMQSAMLQLSWHFGHFGTPTMILHDTGTQFQNQDIQQLLALLGTRHTTTHPYSKQENSIVERMNKEVLRHLRNIIAEQNVAYDWELHLGTVMRIINTQRRISGGLEFPSPAELLYGLSISLERHMYTTPEEYRANVQARGIQNLGRWMDRTIAAQTTALHLAENQQRYRDAEALAQPPKKKHRQQMDFPIGSFVLCDYPETTSSITRRGPPNKLMPFRKGPLLVIAHDGDTYTLRSLVTDRTEVVHVSRLHPFDNSRNLSIEELTKLALTDFIDDYPIDHIVAHSGDPRYKRKMDFKVRWQGQPAERDQWLPYSALRDTSQLHDYLRRSNDDQLRKLIPTQFR